MLPYCTVERFRVLGFGNDLSDIEDVELASILDRATALVNQYCSTPTLPQQHDFRGGTIVDEAHAWRTGQIRTYPWHQPVKVLNSFRIYATNTVYLDIPPTQMFIDNSGKYIEVVSLSLTPVGFWAASGLISLVEPVSKMSYTYGWTFPVSGEVLYATDAYQFRSQNQFWATTPAPVVYKNGASQSSGFTIDYTEGTVTFASPVAATDTITVDYTHTLPPAIGQATGVIASEVLNQRDLIAKGLGSLASIRVEEVELRRQMPRFTTQVATTDWIPDAAKSLLDPYKFWWTM